MATEKIHYLLIGSGFGMTGWRRTLAERASSRIPANARVRVDAA